MIGMERFFDAINVVNNIESGVINARAMVDIVHKANSFHSSIVLHTDHKSIDVKSFLGLTASLIKSRQFRLEIHGIDEEDAKKGMAEIFAKFNLKVQIL